MFAQGKPTSDVEDRRTAAEVQVQVLVRASLLCLCFLNENERCVVLSVCTGCHGAERQIDDR